MVETYLSVFTLPGGKRAVMEREGKAGGEAEEREIAVKGKKRKERKERKEKWILRAPFESGGERRRPR